MSEPANSKQSQLLDELTRYQKDFEGILSRFEHGSNSITIRSEDDRPYRQKVMEVIDLIGDYLPTDVNTYSPQIRDDFNEGINNFYQSPSYNSVSRIISALAALITRVSRNPEILNPRPALKSAAPAAAWPEKITLQWLYHHVPVHLWVAFGGLLIAAFSIGLQIGDRPIGHQVLSGLGLSTHYETIKGEKVLTAPQERLLTLLWEYQRRFASTKLVVSRDGRLFFDDPERQKTTKVNVLKDLFDSKEEDTSRVAEFQQLIDQIPEEYLRRYAEGRFGSPFVVGVTEGGVKYLRAR
jgi:hypothetical protein